MAYTKTTWADGDVITAEKLNNMENGIEGAQSGGSGSGGGNLDSLLAFTEIQLDLSNPPASPDDDVRVTNMTWSEMEAAFGTGRSGFFILTAVNPETGEKVAISPIMNRITQNATGTTYNLAAKVSYWHPRDSAIESEDVHYIIVHEDDVAYCNMPQW